MFNLLRMDLYRMKRSKSIYICFVSLLLVIVSCYVMVYLMATPKGQETALKIGMLKLIELEEGRNLLEGVDILGMFRESNMDGGMYNTIFGIAVALFVCADYQGGFMKNIMTLHRERWTYICSKLMAAGILDFLYLMLSFGFNILMNCLFRNMVSSSGWGGIAFYLVWVWLVSMAFAALIVFLSVFTRSVTVGVVGAVVGGSGLAVLVLSSILGNFHLDGWMKYTIWYNMTYGPSVYSAVEDLRAPGIGLVFLAVYSVAAAVSLIKRDI